MAKYTIEYCCGHTATVQLYGKIKERESYIEWARYNKLCPECYAKEQQAKRQAQNEKAKADADLNNYPELTGSEKQVAWATTIRKDVVDNVKQKFSEIILHRHLSEDVADLFQQVLSNAIQSKTEAKFWIDNRYDFDSGWNAINAFVRIPSNSECFDRICRAEADALIGDLEGRSLEELDFIKDLDHPTLADRLMDRMFLLPDEAEKVAGYFLASEKVKNIKQQLN